MKEKNNGRLGFAPATPTIQSNMAQGKAFLDESPQAILERHEEANVPLMMGSVRHDGSFVLGVIYNQFLKFNKLANDTEFLRTEFVPKCLNALGNTGLHNSTHMFLTLRVIQSLVFLLAKQVSEMKLKSRNLRRSI